MLKDVCSGIPKLPILTGHTNKYPIQYRCLTLSTNRTGNLTGIETICLESLRD